MLRLVNYSLISIRIPPIIKIFSVLFLPKGISGYLHVALLSSGFLCVFSTFLLCLYLTGVYILISRSMVFIAGFTPQTPGPQEAMSTMVWAIRKGIIH